MAVNDFTKWTTEDDDRLRTLLQSGVSVYLAAAKLKRSASAVKERAVILKISIKRMKIGLKAKK